MKKILSIFVLGIGICLSAKAKGIEEDQNFTIPRKAAEPVTVLKPVEEEKPSCTVSTSATYTGTFMGCQGLPVTASSTRSASCHSTIDCQAAFICAYAMAMNLAMADVNSVQEPCL